MSNVDERIFKEGEKAYVIDCWRKAAGISAIVAKAEIVNVDNQKRQFLARLYDKTHYRYGFKDYNRIVFDDAEKAYDVVEKIPKPGTIIHQVIGKKVYSKKIIYIESRNIGGVRDIVMVCERGTDVPIIEMDKTVFLTKERARIKLLEML